MLLDGPLWVNQNLILTLTFHFVLKFICMVLALTLPLPNGIFAPMITIGAVFGRLYGHCLSSIGEVFGIQLIKCKLHFFSKLSCWHILCGRSNLRLRGYHQDCLYSDSHIRADWPDHSDGPCFARHDDRLCIHRLNGNERV